MPDISQLGTAAFVDWQVMIPSGPITVGTVPGDVVELGQHGTAAFVDAASLVPSRQYASPIGGGSVTISPVGSSLFVIIKPSGTIAGLTITFPAAAPDGFPVWIFCTQIVNATLTFSGATFDGVSLPSSLTANAPAMQFVYGANDGKWTRII